MNMTFQTAARRTVPAVSENRLRIFGANGDDGGDACAATAFASCLGCRKRKNSSASIDFEPSTSASAQARNHRFVC